ncbi:MAG: L-aspartate oxidase [Clostridiales bacterium]|nr:L-aspartate oxidase [Clostridiales bacterium]
MKKIKKENYIYTDVVIVGSGVAGLFAALCLPVSMNILVITKEDLKECDSYLAQGGVCVLKDINDFNCYFEDTMKAGHYENNPESVRVMIESSPEIINTLVELGVKFDTDTDGEFDYTREGAHSQNRILHHKDETGKEITATLLSIARKRENITFVTSTAMIDLVKKNNVCLGIVCQDEFDEAGVIIAGSTVLATGGIGGLFKNTTNFPHITGDSFALALKHNIELQDLNYIQIHPTTLYSKKSGRRFLISESVRGEGAVLLNENGERFVDELQPRDVVTDAICKEMEKFGTDHVYITLPTMTSEQARRRFPNIFDECMEEGYDITKDLVPVTPSQHYLMGGIKTDINARSSMKNLFAVGETACNGVHGRNRLASNSLLESLVFSKRAADLIAKTAPAPAGGELDVELQVSLDKKEREARFKEIIMHEIKEKDREFYDKWCCDEA